MEMLKGRKIDAAVCSACACVAAVNMTTQESDCAIAGGDKRMEYTCTEKNIVQRATWHHHHRRVGTTTTTVPTINHHQ